MFQYEFYDPKAYHSSHKGLLYGKVPPEFISEKDITMFKSAFWSEHCLECSAPECYSTCPLYSPRPDGGCRRLAYGMRNSRNLADSPYQVELEFKRWGKLETIITKRSATAEETLEQDRKDRASTALQRSFLSLPLISESQYSERKWQEITRMNAHRARTLGTKDEVPTPFFLFQTYSFMPEPFKFLFDVTADTVPVLSSTIQINPGYNQYIARVDDVFDHPGRLRARLYPENDLEAHVMIFLLGFVDLTDVAQEKASALADPDVLAVRASSGQDSAPPIKCVVWDLDNTMWDGVLIESDPESLTLNPGIRESLSELDKRGILQTIASKNTQEQVEPVLRALGIENFFVGVKANWSSKSESIRDLADDLNIGLDTFAFIDDSPFERAEVNDAYPEIRTYSNEVTALDDSKTPTFLSFPEFDVQVTADASRRREMYQVEAKRKQAEKSTGTRTDFLKRSGIHLHLKAIDTEAEQDRAFELMTRTNQLNLAGKKYTREEFDKIVAEPGTRSFIGFCDDNFGSYGQILYLRSREPSDSRDVVIDEFAMSCRVAAKSIEPALSKSLLELLTLGGEGSLTLKGHRTERNHLLTDSFQAAGFTERSRGEDLVLKLNSRDDLVDSNIVKVTV